MAVISPSSDAGSNAAFTRSEQVLPDESVKKIEKQPSQLALNNSSNALSAHDSVDEKDAAALGENVRRLKVVPAAPPAEYAKDDTRKELDEFRRDGEEGRERVELSESKQSRAAEKTAAMSDAREPASLGKAKEPLQKNENEPSGLGFSSNGAPARLDQPALGSLILAPRWTLSAEGVLLRSFNAGKTWDAIPVANNVQFRAVNAVGNEIWVGGSQGVLYHSSDAGNLWTRVTPVVAGTTLTSDIIGIEFTDTQHGKITTADHVGWTTVDGGQTWSVK